MAYKRLGAEEIDGSTNPIDTNVSLYQVPSGNEAIISTIYILNKHATDTATVRLAHVDGAIGVVAEEDYILKSGANAKIPSGHAKSLIGLGISMEASDSLLIRSDKVDVNFIVWGCERRA